MVRHPAAVRTQLVQAAEVARCYRMGPHSAERRLACPNTSNAKSHGTTCEKLGATNPDQAVGISAHVQYASCRRGRPAARKHQHGHPEEVTPGDSAQRGRSAVGPHDDLPRSIASAVLKCDRTYLRSRTLHAKTVPRAPRRRRWHKQNPVAPNEAVDDPKDQPAVRAVSIPNERSRVDPYGQAFWS